MNNDYSKQSLIAFLDYERDKGLVKDATISSRKASVNAVFAVLSPEEGEDVRGVDVEEAIARLANKRGADFSPQTLNVYKSRVLTAIRDFLEYRKNPAGFKTVTTQKPPRTIKPEKGSSDKNMVQDTVATGYHSGLNNDMAFPIPVRPGVVVKLVGVPSDLTKKEAAKISNIVMALAVSEEE